MKSFDLLAICLLLAWTQRSASSILGRREPLPHRRHFPPFVQEDPPELPEERIKVIIVSTVVDNRREITIHSPHLPNWNRPGTKDKPPIAPPPFSSHSQDGGVPALHPTHPKEVSGVVRTRRDVSGQAGVIEGMNEHGANTIQFTVTAEGLPSMDPFRGEPDPFLMIAYSNDSSPDDFVHFYRSSTLMNQHEASWPELIKFDNYIPGAKQRLQFEIRDNDVADFDDSIGYAVINIDDCVQEVYGPEKTEQRACHTLISGESGILYVSIRYT